MKKLLSLVLIILLFAGCSDENRLLRDALKAAGENRVELETVLNHYKTIENDPQKLAAAKYLIANMPAHYSYRDTAAINSYYRKALDILGKGETPDWEQDTICKISEREFWWLTQDVVSDVKIIKADYLIHSIDHAFNQWRTKPWVCHFSYEEFRDWLLPYKVVDCQSLDNWREILSAYYSDSLNTIPSTDVDRNTIYGAIEIVRNEIHTKQSDIGLRVIWEKPSGIPLKSAETWVRMTYGNCMDYVTMGTAVFRSLGLPAAVDYAPLWGRNSDGHSWYVFPSDRGRIETTINALIMPAGQQFYAYERIPKVFRKSYSINKRIYDYSRKAQYVYPFDLCIQDVTDQYNLTSDIDVDVFKRVKLVDKYVYIAMFSAVEENQWAILDFGEFKRGKAHFHNMGRNMMYIALGYNGTALVPISSPFILEDNGDIRYIRFDDSTFKSVRLKRKYYESYNVVDMRRRLLGGKIQCSDMADFKNDSTLYTIETTDIPDKIRIDGAGCYRYWRYMSPDGSWGSVAEVAFFDENGEKMTGRGIANAEAGEDAIERAYDDNWLTNFEINQENGNWVGMDFGSPKHVSSVRIIPRSDDNDIHPGQEYELCYLNSRSKWRSLGSKVAVDNYLEFDSVPNNALLWLINHTGGVDERPFFYNEDGAIEWW
jgi:hypothetical protein